VEKLDPGFAARVLGRLSGGVVLVSGTNGKTTTAKAVTELLTAAGLRVFTNNTGSNFIRGVISSLLRKVRSSGRLDADIAVLELDEAHAVNFVEAIKPRHTLLLNVMRDQLDRFGEIDYTAALLAAVARNTTNTVVLNREDSRLAAIPQREQLTAEVRWFGLAPELRAEFPEDDALYNEVADTPTQGTAQEHKGDGGFCVVGQPQTSSQQSVTTQKPPSPLCSKEPSPCAVPCVVLKGFSHDTAVIEVEGKVYETSLALRGVYNAYNAAAALALVHAIVPETPLTALVHALKTVRPAFGRGESVTVDGQPVELILVKNPGGFRLALKSYDPLGCATMIAINDEYADGRDMSWLFDVDFSSLGSTGVALVSGTRAYDMALRLEYDEVPFDTVERDLGQALDTFLAGSPDMPRRVYCTYTAMLALRKALAAKTTVERVR
jgi:UDP-N-acetylmuramyl tripeptide synthase